VNYVSLSMMIEFRTLKRWTISVKKSTACSDLIYAIGRASIHFENLSMATSKWVKPLGAFWSSPTRSRPQTTKGQVMGIIWSAWASR
jgi:hypothetical protein